MRIVRGIVFAIASAAPYVLVGFLGDWKDLAALAACLAFISTILYGMFSTMETPRSLRDALYLAWDVYSSMYCLFGILAVSTVWRDTFEENE